MGGKSSSSSSSSNSTTTTTGSATGTVGDVFQGESITITENLPDNAVDVFRQLVELAGQAIDVGANAAGAALESNQQLAQAAKQPDLTIIEGYQKQVYYAIGAVALIAAYLLFRKK